MWRATDYSLEASIVVRGCAEDDGLDEERLVAVALLVAPDDAEAPAARVAPPQYNLVAAVQVAARKEPRAEWRRGWKGSTELRRASSLKNVYCDSYNLSKTVANACNQGIFPGQSLQPRFFFIYTTLLNIFY